MKTLLLAATIGLTSLVSTSAVAADKYMPNPFGSPIMEGYPCFLVSTLAATASEKYYYGVRTAKAWSIDNPDPRIKRVKTFLVSEARKFSLDKELAPSDRQKKTEAFREHAAKQCSTAQKAKK